MKVFIIGANGFIGSHLVDAMLKSTDWQISALDIRDHHLQSLLTHPRLAFQLGDMTQNADYIEQQIQACDVVLPLAAIATPATYVQDPLRIFALDFEANLAIVRACVKHKRRVVFPSTSEVYGMCPDREFDELSSNLVLGPIHKERWIYSCSKQLMDRIIFAYGKREGLPYTLFRPFNWIGPRLDDIHNKKPGGSRAVTQMLGNLLRGEDIQLVDGGKQERSFIYIDDAIDALLKIIANENNVADQQIYNIGNPKNIASIREMAELLQRFVKAHPNYQGQAENTRLQEIAASEYYGAGYQDVSARVPAIARVQSQLHWQPTTDLATSLNKIVDYYLTHG